jgi:membrane complex biogenesis BtpA family protein
MRGAAVIHQPKNTASVAMGRLHYSERVRMVQFADAMRLSRTLIGMVHLAPLPGSPRWEGSMERVTTRAVTDAMAIVEGGLDALLIENFGDVPFAPGRVEAATVAAMSVVAAAIRDAVAPVPLGVNVLRNDARSALAIAAATGAAFIRANVHAGAVVTDQGLLQAEAYGTLRERRLLGHDVAIFADVQTKHAVPLAPIELEYEARDLVHRSLADAVIVTGRSTGEAADLADLKRVRSAVAEVPVLVGSGVTAESAAELLTLADGLIVGTWIKREGRIGNPVDLARVRRLVDAARAGR